MKNNINFIIVFIIMKNKSISNNNKNNNSSRGAQNFFNALPTEAGSKIRTTKQITNIIIVA